MMGMVIAVIHKLNSITSLLFFHQIKNEELEIKLTPGKSLKYSGGTSANPSLTIYNVDEEDSGLYWCEAINSSSLSRSDHVQHLMMGMVIAVIHKLNTITSLPFFFPSNKKCIFDSLYF
jgi:hypothetical protein